MRPGKRMRERFGDHINALCKELDATLGMMTTGHDQVYPEDYTIVNLYTIYTSKDFESVRYTVAKHFPMVECDCGHDCCGCYFRFSTIARPMFDQEKTAYYIVDTFHRNI